LITKLQRIKDHRKRKEYHLEELLMAGILLFVFKQGSHNEMDNARKNPQFAENYERIFHLRAPNNKYNEISRRIAGINICWNKKKHYLCAVKRNTDRFYRSPKNR
jgi:hypothetical protein